MLHSPLTVGVAHWNTFKTWFATSSIRHFNSQNEGGQCLWLITDKVHVRVRACVRVCVCVHLCMSVCLFSHYMNHKWHWNTGLLCWLVKFDWHWGMCTSWWGNSQIFALFLLRLFDKGKSQCGDAPNKRIFRLHSCDRKRLHVLTIFFQFWENEKVKITALTIAAAWPSSKALWASRGRGARARAVCGANTRAVLFVHSDPVYRWTYDLKREKRSRCNEVADNCHLEKKEMGFFRRRQAQLILATNFITTTVLWKTPPAYCKLV